LIFLVGAGLIAIAYYRKTQKYAATNGLQDPLLQNEHFSDGLELGVVAGAGLGATPQVASLTKTQAPERGVRVINKRGLNFPTRRISSAAAESYGTIVANDRALPSNEKVPDESDSIIDGESSVEAAGDTNIGNQLVAGIAAAAAGATPTCKVLVIGQASADMKSIRSLLEETEEEVRNHYQKDHVKIEITVRPLNAQQLRQADEALSSTELSEYHAIFLAFSSTPCYLAIVGPGGKFDSLLDKMRTFLVPEVSLYFVGTGDVDAPTSEQLMGASTGSAYSSMGNGVMQATPASSLGVGVFDADQIVSNGLKNRLGPTQLAHIQLFFAAGRFLSWNSEAMPVHRKLLRRHLRFLTYHKPKRDIDSELFACFECKRDFTMAEVKDLKEFDHGQESIVPRQLCKSCSKGHCSECGEHLVPDEQGSLATCATCGADVITVGSLVTPSEIECATAAKATKRGGPKGGRAALCWEL
jgi:hypothetical protein